MSYFPNSATASSTVAQRSSIMRMAVVVVMSTRSVRWSVASVSMSKTPTARPFSFTPSSGAKGAANDTMLDARSSGNLSSPYPMNARFTIDSDA